MSPERWPTACQMASFYLQSRTAQVEPQCLSLYRKTRIKNESKAFDNPCRRCFREEERRFLLSNLFWKIYKSLPIPSLISRYIWPISSLTLEVPRFQSSNDLQAGRTMRFLVEPLNFLVSDSVCQNSLWLGRPWVDINQAKYLILTLPVTASCILK